MRKTIKGSRYDTDTARFIGAVTSPVAKTHPKYYRLELYRTKAKKYFFHHITNTAMSGEVETKEFIVPATEESAQDWCLENGITTARGLPFTGKLAHLDTGIPADLFRKVVDTAKATHRSRAEIVAMALSKFFEEEN